MTRPWPTGHWSLTSMCDTSVSTAWYTGRSASPAFAIKIFSTRRASGGVLDDGDLVDESREV